MDGAQRLSSDESGDGMTHINWISYYSPVDGYGRFSSRLVAALQRNGSEVTPATRDQINAPGWLHARWGLDWRMPNYMLYATIYGEALAGKMLVVFNDRG